MNDFVLLMEGIFFEKDVKKSPAGCGRSKTYVMAF